MTDLTNPGVPGLPVPPMPAVDVSKLTRYPDLLVDSGKLRHGLAFQRRPEFEGGACFAVVRMSDLAGIKVLERVPLSGQGWAASWASLVQRDPASAELIVGLLAEREGTAVLLPPPPPRFPSTPNTRRQILNAIANGNEKYARPFDRGSIALASFAGTQSWSDYGDVVLQMAILDTLLSIEDKLGKLLEGPRDGAVGEDAG